RHGTGDQGPRPGARLAEPNSTTRGVAPADGCSDSGCAGHAHGAPALSRACDPLLALRALGQGRAPQLVERKLCGLVAPALRAVLYMAPRPEQAGAFRG